MGPGGGSPGAGIASGQVEGRAGHYGGRVWGSCGSRLGPRCCGVSQEQRGAGDPFCPPCRLLVPGIPRDRCKVKDRKSLMELQDFSIFFFS